jgi:hypothetical protein
MGPDGGRETNARRNQIKKENAMMAGISRQIVATASELLAL